LLWPVGAQWAGGRDPQPVSGGVLDENGHVVPGGMAVEVLVGVPDHLAHLGWIQGGELPPESLRDPVNRGALGSSTHPGQRARPGGCRSITHCSDTAHRGDDAATVAGAKPSGRWGTTEGRWAVPVELVSLRPRPVLRTRVPIPTPRSAGTGGTIPGASAAEYHFARCAQRSRARRIARCRSSGPRLPRWRAAPLPGPAMDVFPGAAAQIRDVIGLLSPTPSSAATRCRFRCRLDIPLGTSPRLAGPQCVERKTESSNEYRVLSELAPALMSCLDRRPDFRRAGTAASVDSRRDHRQMRRYLLGASGCARSGSVPLEGSIDSAR
jgi:hypothetical protein